MADDVAISFSRNSYPTEIATLPSVTRDDVLTDCYGVSLSLCITRVSFPLTFSLKNL